MIQRYLKIFFPYLILTEIGILILTLFYFFHPSPLFELLGTDVLDQVFLLAVADVIMGFALFFLIGFFVEKPIFNFMPAKIVFLT